MSAPLSAVVLLLVALIRLRALPGVLGADWIARLYRACGDEGGPRARRNHGDVLHGRVLSDARATEPQAGRRVEREGGDRCGAAMRREIERRAEVGHTRSANAQARRRELHGPSTLPKSEFTNSLILAMFFPDHWAARGVVAGCRSRVRNMAMMRLLIVFLVVAPSIALGLWWVRSRLPDPRVASAVRTLPGDAVAFRALLDAVEDQPRWRRNVTRVERQGETWTEFDARGQAIRFRWTERGPDRYRLALEGGLGVSGEWTATWGPVANGLQVRVEERVSVPHPFRRLMARVFFDPEDLMNAWFDDVDAELRRKQVAHG